MLDQLLQVLAENAEPLMAAAIGGFVVIGWRKLRDIVKATSNTWDDKALEALEGAVRKVLDDKEAEKAPTSKPE